MALFSIKSALMSLLLSAAALVMVSCIAADERASNTQHQNAQATEETVQISRGPGSHETTYSTSTGPCRVSWVASVSEVNRGVIRHYVECDRSLAEQLRLISRVIAEVFKDTARADQVHTLSWGRLTPDGARDFVMTVRLAEAAVKSPQWNVGSGRPKNGDINGFVRRLANDQMIYPELRDLFRKSELEISASAVEKVLVSGAGELPFFDLLKARGIEAAEKVPWDCQLWFSIKRIPGPVGLLHRKQN